MGDPPFRYGVYPEVDANGVPIWPRRHVVRPAVMVADHLVALPPYDRVGSDSKHYFYTRAARVARRRDKYWVRWELAQ